MSCNVSEVTERLENSQLILQPFRCFIYVTVHSPTLLSLLLRHKLFTCFTWRAAYDPFPAFDLNELLRLDEVKCHSYFVKTSIIPFSIPLPYFNFLLTGIFTWLTAHGHYRAMICRERELAVDHMHTFLTTQGHGGPPQMSDQLNAGATSETTRTLKTIHIIHSHIHSNKADMRRMNMMDKWYTGTWWA